MPGPTAAVARFVAETDGRAIPAAALALALLESLEEVPSVATLMDVLRG